MAVIGRGQVTGPLTSSGNPLYILALPAAAITIWALLIAGEFSLIAVAVLLGALFGTAPDSIMSNIVLSGVAGAFAGVAMAVIRSFRRKPGSTEKSFVSALFSKGLATPSLDGLFWGRAVLGTLVGILVGALTGADGFISFPQAITGTAGDVFSVHSPLPSFLSGGMAGPGSGFGGPGDLGFWATLFLVLVIILTAVLLGSLSGLFVHLVVRALAGATKASTKELVLRSLQDPAQSESGSKERPFRQGIIRGALAGMLAGVLEALFTLWGIAVFYRPLH